MLWWELIPLCVKTTDNVTLCYIPVLLPVGTASWNYTALLSIALYCIVLFCFVLFLSTPRHFEFYCCGYDYNKILVRV